MALRGKDLANYMNKYSDVYIINYFRAYSNSLTQLSAEYYSDPVKRNKLFIYLSDIHIAFRDALIDPSNHNNARIIKDHQIYFSDPNNKANGQVRGPQYDLSDQMFVKAAKGGNGIEKTNLNGEFLGLLNTKNTHNVQYPLALKSASSGSFRQGIELCNARIISSSTGHQVIYTNDDPGSVSTQGHPVINNMPQSQSLNDYFRCIPVTPLITSVVSSHSSLASPSSFVYLQEDDKKRSLNAFLNNSNIQQNVSVGTVDENEEIAAVSFLARRAMMGFINVSHVDSTKNNDVGLILKQVEQTGKIEHAKELVNFPNVFSNRHVD